MAIIHKTTLVPGKLELLTDWMPAQPWYAGPGRTPELAKTGGFRLDDPDGAVGIEFMLVTDGSGGGAATYQVPLTYRSAALPGAEASLIGTAEHGVLGRRWIYDGTGDPVLVAQLVALIQGEAEPQAQSLSSTPDPTVTGMPVTTGSLTVTGTAVTTSGQAGTDLRIETAAADGSEGRLTMRVHRILRAAGRADLADEAVRPCLSATWRLPDGTPAHGVLATAQYTPRPPARP
jgi:Maltokinase N-terminal cap domain